MSVDLLSLENSLKRISSGMSFSCFLRELLFSAGYPQATFERTRQIDFCRGAIIHSKLFVRDVSNVENALKEYVRIDNAAKGVKVAIFYDGGRIGIVNLLTSESNITQADDFYKCARLLTPLIGWKKEQSQSENEEATLSVAVAFAELYNDLIADNPQEDIAVIDDYMVRILYLCLLNGEGLFDGIDLRAVLDAYTRGATNQASKILSQLFEIVGGREVNDRIVAFEHLFPYDLEEFKSPIKVLAITSDTLECLQSILAKQWGNVDVAVLGGIVQSIMDRGRGYRQVLPSNDYIDKLFDPLFVSSFQQRIASAHGNRSSLEKIADEIRSIKIFDPSCSFGAILVGGYIRVVGLLRKIQVLLGEDTNDIPYPTENIYGIESQELPLKIARLSLLWIFYQNANGSKKSRLNIALKGLEKTHLVKGRAPRLNWTTICKPNPNVYIVSNPPYAGARRQSSEEKQDCLIALSDLESRSGDLDLASCWAYLSAKYLMQGAAGCSLMTTNSIVQGVHAGEFWPNIFKLGVKISFAFSAFKLRPVVFKNAPGVTVVIVGLARAESAHHPQIISGIVARHVEEISPYLIPGHTIVRKTKNAISSILPKMNKGNMPYDDGSLLIDTYDEYQSAIRNDSRVSEYLKKVVGSKEFIHEIPRWCIWVRPSEVSKAEKIPFLKERFLRCQAYRTGKSDAAAKKLAVTPWRFREQNETTTSSIVVPSVSSENRAYIPIGFIDSGTIVTNLSFVIYDCEPWLFGVLSSKMHNLWIRTVCGGLETRIRYSSELGYNTFPFPNISEADKDKITSAVRSVIIARELTPNLTLGQKYDSPTPELMNAHRELDCVIERCYQCKPFLSDEDRLNCLMSMYEEMKEGAQ